MKFPKEIKGLSEDAYLYGMLLKCDVDLLVKNQDDAETYRIVNEVCETDGIGYPDFLKDHEIVERLEKLMCIHHHLIPDCPICQKILDGKK